MGKFKQQDINKELEKRSPLDNLQATLGIALGKGLKLGRPSGEDAYKGDE